MRKYKIFVSGKQKELLNERRAVKEYIQQDMLLKKHFEDVWVFEDEPAESKSPKNVYIDELLKRDIYIGIFGYEYSSDTEEECRIAKNNGKYILIYIKGEEKDDAKRDEKIRKLIKEFRDSTKGYKCKRFKDIPELKHNIYESLVKFVEEKNIISNVNFDMSICEDATLKDIDKEKVKSFLKKAKTERGLDISPDLPMKEILMRLKLIREGKLTNSAVLLFSNNPQDFFIQAEVKCVRFKGTNVAGTMIDMKPIGGNLIDQVLETEKFIYDRISMSAWVESGKIERQEKWEYPPKAIREALVNSIAHRDYYSTSKAQVRIFDDRIEFWNPGRLPEGWTVETLKQKHESKPYNPLIAKAFFWIKYIEEVGTGTNKIIQWCKE